MNAEPNEDGDFFDVNDWLDAHADEPAREELEPDYSSLAREAA